MEGIVYKNSIAIDRRLASLNMTAAELTEVVLAAVGAKNSCTENDPAGSPGWMAWKEGSRRLREIYRPKGFQKSNEDGVPWLVDPASGTRFCVCNTDDGTGIAGSEPQQRSKKGPATDRAVSKNSSPLFDACGVDMPVRRAGPVVRQPFSIQSWYLCIYIEDGVVRAELSLPTGMSGGFFDGFSERIIIIGPEAGTLNSVSRRTDPEDDGGEDEFDIPVSRK